MNATAKNAKLKMIATQVLIGVVVSIVTYKIIGYLETKASDSTTAKNQTASQPPRQVTVSNEEETPIT